VKTGRYLSASEVVREALRLLEERDRIKEMRLQELRRDSRRDSTAAGRRASMLPAPA